MPPVMEDIEQHYQATFGAPHRSLKFHRQAREVAVYVWRPEDTAEEVWFYATAGASLNPMRGLPAEHRFEFFCGLDQDISGMEQSMAGLAGYGEDYGVAVDHGHTVPVGRPAWEGTQMCVWLLALPVEVIVPELVGDGFHVEWLQAVPLYESEREAKTRMGMDAFMAEFERLQVPFWSATRSPAF